LAGPVVACAVVMPPDKRAIPGVNDSKQLSARRREELAVKIRERALAISIAAASVREIDRHNIYQASVIAIKRAIRRLAVKPDHVVVDGRPIGTLAFVHTAVVKGDARCFSVACASIIAKVTRDRIMQALALRRPGYRWEQNVGYATRAHIGGIAELGITPHHRRSFLPCRQLSLEFHDPSEVVIDTEALERLVVDDPAGLTLSAALDIALAPPIDSAREASPGA